VVGSDHNHEVFRTEYFGPLLAVHATATSTRCSDTSTAAPPTASPVP
jgi:hypothetical protein